MDHRSAEVHHARRAVGDVGARAGELADDACRAERAANIESKRDACMFASDVHTISYV